MHPDGRGRPCGWLYALFSPGDTGRRLAIYRRVAHLAAAHGLQASHARWAWPLRWRSSAVHGSQAANSSAARRCTSEITSSNDDGRRAVACRRADRRSDFYHPLCRLAPFLPATALGVLACWQLLRGVRMNDVRSGFMAGAGRRQPAPDRSGLVFLLIGLLWWAGFALVGTTGGAGSRQPLLRLLGWWLAGAVVVLGPVAGAWLQSRPAFAHLSHRRRSHTDWFCAALDFWLNLAPTVKSLFWIGDASPVFGISTHLLDDRDAALHGRPALFFG